MPASEIEAIILQIRRLLADKPMLADWMHKAGYTAKIEAGLASAGKAAPDIADDAAATSPEVRAIICVVVRRIDLSDRSIRIVVDTNAVAG